MQSPPITTQELLDENRRLRAFYDAKIAEGERDLRDEFAKAALIGLLSSETSVLANWSWDERARHCYHQADAMLIARGRKVGA